MKLVIGGSTGFVGTELISQALSDPAITSIIALSRRETPTPPGSTKLKSIACDNFESYPDNVREELKDVDACIWTIAITPAKLKGIPFDDVCKISRDYAVTAIRTLAELRSTQDRPLRFIYVSGHVAPRSLAEVPPEFSGHGLTDYGLMRGEAETQILAYAEQSNGTVESCVVKPGVIDAPDKEKRIISGIPNIDIRVFAATMLDQVINGFKKDTLRNDDMIQIGEQALAKK
ncbi:hypothetical protein F5Y04DRAFT_129802 [Hypomontagnella monticulosa]|nr:hypothetical protein F5Y04DRAFT_129802 [Hypomontagnella monticulosa]